MTGIGLSQGWRFVCRGLLAGILLGGCSRQAEVPPEDRIKALLDAAEVAVERRSLDASAKLISFNYTDEAGRDHKALKRLLMGYFLRHKSIHVLKQILEISLLNNSSARVVLYAGVAGNRPDRDDSLAQWRGDLIRLEAELILEDDDWRLLSASWRRASAGELL
ncbi:MAG: hypothetical protein ABFR65_13185 [Pseudomonadota bacterium]